MKEKIFTWPRLIYVLVFAYINTYVSQWFSYFKSQPNIVDFLFNLILPCFLLLIGLYIGISYIKTYNKKYEPINGEMFGLIIAVILAFGNIARIIVMNIY